VASFLLAGDIVLSIFGFDDFHRDVLFGLPWQLVSPVRRFD